MGRKGKVAYLYDGKWHRYASLRMFQPDNTDGQT